MAKYIIDETTLQNLANAIRKVNGETKSYTPTEMIDAVTHIMDSATYILVDDDGNEYPAVFVENETVFTATANDIRIGTVAASNAGIITGEKEIPSYVTTEGYKVVTAGSSFVMTIPRYDYTKLQAIFCPFNTSISNSVGAEKVAIENKVYPVKSTVSEKDIVIDSSTQTINFGFTNTSSVPWLIRFFTYKEIY